MFIEKDKLSFGTGGAPRSTGVRNNPLEGVKQIYHLGLDCMQLEFDLGVRMKEDVSSQLRRLSYELGVSLTSHGPSYINLNAREQDKIDSAIERLIKTAKVSDLCGVESMAFHAAFYMKDPPDEVFDLVCKSLGLISHRLARLDIDIILRPILTGKTSQFGSLEELMALSKLVRFCEPCIDFSHQYARTGKFNSYPEFCQILDRLKEELGPTCLKNMHIQISGIESDSKGTLKRLNLEKSSFKWKELMKALKDYGCQGFVICKSPNLEEDALMMKNYYKELHGKKTPMSSMIA